MFPNFAQLLAAIRSRIPWAKKRTYTNVKKQSSVSRVCCDPSVKELRLPRRFPRKCIGKIYRQPSIILRAAELRAKRASFRKKRSLPRPNAEYCGPRVGSETARDKPLSLEEKILARYQELEARRTHFLHEISGQRVRLNDLGKTAYERLEQQAEHDVRAKELRAKLKQKHRSPPFNAKVSALPSIYELADNRLQFDGAYRTHQGWFERGEIPPGTRMPFRNEWSIWEGVRIRTEKDYAKVCKNRRKAVREVDAQVEEEHIRTRMGAGRALVADEQKDADQDAAAHDASIPFIPPQTDDPELYAWEIFDRRWAAIKCESNEKVPFLLGFRQVPWPQFIPAGSLKDFDESNIRHFLLSPRRPGYASRDTKNRIRQSILLYHPDKFNSHVLPHVIAEERGMVAAGASEITAHLNSLLKSNKGS